MTKKAEKATKKDKPKPPKLSKEKLSDLTADEKGAGIRGGKVWYCPTSAMNDTCSL